MKRNLTIAFWLIICLAAFYGLLWYVVKELEKEQAGPYQNSKSFQP